MHQTIERCGWSLVWFGVLIGGLDLWSQWVSWSWAGVLAPLLVLVAIVGFAWTWFAPGSPLWPLRLAAMAAAVLSTLANQGVNIHVRQYYSTDSAAFNQVAARLLLHGIDPYAASMSPADQLLQTPANYWTYTVGGGHVTHVSYPAGSFLLQVPALALGFHHQIVDWMDLFAWIVTGVLIFALLPGALRWVGGLLLLTPILSDIFGSGGTDAIFLPFLVLAVWRWDRFGRGEGAWAVRWMGPVALGLACAIKQTPWFCAPFLVIGVFIEAHQAGRRPWRCALGYLAVVIGVFAAVNLPFVIWQAHDWLHGTTLPFSVPLVADGQGLVSLALHGVTGGVSLTWLSVAGALVVVAPLAAMVVWYPTMKRLWMPLLPLCFFVATRSLSTYLIDLYPVAFVAVISVAPAAGPALRRAVGGRRLVPGLAVLVPTVAALVVSVVAFSIIPLQVGVRSFSSSHAATSLDAVTVTVRNTTDGTVTPRFMVSSGSSHPSGFWHAKGHRQVVLGPHASTVVTLFPDLYAPAPDHGGRWLVEAYTASPEALSTSPIQVWKLGKAK